MMNKIKNVIKKIIRYKSFKYIDIIKSRIADDSLNNELHLCLAQAYFDIGNIDLAIACYRTANYLGAEIDHKLMFQGKPDLFEFPVDQYVRYKVVADIINSKYRNISVLDVGGGAGRLGYFLPEQKYILADINGSGITAIPLPFGNNSIDVICTTDTLEHIPRSLREKFISEMIRVAKKEIHIVVPTQLPPGYSDYNEFFYRITGAPETKEHIEYKVPTLNELHLLLDPYKESCDYEIKSCSSLITIPLLLCHYLVTNERYKMPEINRYFNKYFYNEIKNGSLPIEHHIKIEKK